MSEEEKPEEVASGRLRAVVTKRDEETGNLEYDFWFDGRLFESGNCHKDKMQDHLREVAMRAMSQ